MNIVLKSYLKYLNTFINYTKTIFKRSYSCPCSCSISIYYSCNHTNNLLLFQIAVVLLASTTVGVVATAYYGISHLTEKTQKETAGLVEHEFEVMGTKLKIDVFGDCKIYLANTGTKDVPIDVISFYANEKPV
ncbi:MAG: hypothetical protein B6U88_00885, partial [Candidatus Aenigmarchaeota archaeon ex4484_56]